MQNILLEYRLGDILRVYRAGKHFLPCSGFYTEQIRVFDWPKKENTNLVN